MATTERTLEVLGAVGLAALLGYEVDKNIGLKIAGVTYGRGPATTQATAVVTVVNHTDSGSAYTLVGYQVEQNILTTLIGRFGIVDSIATKFAKIASTKTWAGKSYPNGLVEGHWYSQSNIQASGAGAVNPTLAQQERAIGFTCARGQTTRVSAYTATPFSDLVSTGTVGLVNFWFVFAGTGVTGGRAVAAWLDSKPSMPAI